MIEGSPYNKLIRVNGQPLSPAQAESEALKVQPEIDRRRKETPAARQERLVEYRRERQQNQALMEGMAKAFKFKLVEEDTVNGRRCLVLGATPRPDYQPTSRDTKVLKGMRGKMWIDANQYQWVRVRAEEIGRAHV